MCPDSRRYRAGADERALGSFRSHEPGSSCRGRSSLVWTRARAAVPHRLVDDVVGFLSGDRLAFRIHFREVLTERFGDLLASLIGYGGWRKSLNAHGLMLRYGPPEQAFDCRLLVGREVFHVTDHMLPTNTFRLILAAGEVNLAVTAFRESQCSWSS